MATDIKAFKKPYSANVSIAIGSVLITTPKTGIMLESATIVPNKKG